jgi:uncharacterized OsmC-like protein
MQTLTVQGSHRGGMRVSLQAGGHPIEVDYPLPDHEAEAPTSLELLLASLASCAANGLAVLLRRDGHSWEALDVRASGRRRETHPTVLEAIHLEVEVRSALDREVLLRALDLAEARICPIWAMLAPGTPITRTLVCTAPVPVP